MTIDTTSFSESELDIASAWIVRLRSEQVTEQDHQDFALWLAESQRHRMAFDEMVVLWDVMGSYQEPNQSSITALLGKVSSEFSPSASNDGDNGLAHRAYEHGGATTKPTVVNFSKPTPRHQSARPLSFKLGTLAALVASVLVVGIVFLRGQGPIAPSPSPSQQLYATPVGKQQRFTLDDGSVLELNTGSRLSVKYTPQQRLITLISGEAFFQVAHDSDRPFLVSAASGQVRAVGTAFNIRIQRDVGMLVAVTEGRVKVTSANQVNSEKGVSLDFGQQTLVADNGEIGTVEDADLDLIAAWREKTLIFRDADLTSALVELNRYLAQPVDTTDPSLEQLRITGTFSLEEPEATLSAIIDTFELQYYKNPFDSKTRLYRR